MQGSFDGQRRNNDHAGTIRDGLDRSFEKDASKEVVFQGSRGCRAPWRGASLCAWLEVGHVGVALPRPAATELHDGTYDPCDRPSHLDHNNGLEHAMRQSKQEARLTDSYRVGYRDARNIYECPYDALEDIVATIIVACHLPKATRCRWSQ
jgi:hypothetical protein